MATMDGRRRRTVQGGNRRAPGALASRRFGRRLAGAMAALTIVYAAAGLYGVVHAARNYGPVYLGMSRAEVRYIYGPPAGRSADDGLWRVHANDSETTLRFDGAGRVDAVGCRAVAEGGTCPDVLGVGIGQSEDAVWTVFGTPTRETFRDDRKIMAYPGLGIRFDLQRTTIVAVEHRRADGIAALALRAVSLLAP